MKVSLSPKDTYSFSQKLLEALAHSNQWFLETPMRALEQAYQAALKIQSIETEYFDGKEISNQSSKYTNNVLSIWQADLNSNLRIIKLRLAEFKVSRAVVNVSNLVILDKLSFIDKVISKYDSQKLISNQASAASPQVVENKFVSPVGQIARLNSENNLPRVNVNNLPPVSEKTGVLPRSIGRTINKIKTELDPTAEEELVQNFRNSQKQTKIALKFLALLIIVPVLTQQIAKNFIVSPVINQVRGEKEVQVFINSEMEEKALKELQTFEESLKFRSLIQTSPELSKEAIEAQVKRKAVELAQEFQEKSRSAMGNVFADAIAVVAFACLIATSKKEIVILKSFMDTIVYGLSDSAKAFIIILFTDIFVGFHSPHGWEVLLEGFAAHLGIAPNRNLIFMFIATFPVVLDTILKYWIFRYLSRTSPSAVATLKTMNE